MKKFLFRPEVGLYGIQRIDVVQDCFILAGAGVGGGSLNYANTLYEPPEPFYRDRQWSHITDWKSELAPYYDQAKRMLGVIDVPPDHARRRGDEEGRRRDGGRPHVRADAGGRLLRRPGQAEGEEVTDPFFGGAGPERSHLHQLRLVHDRVPAQREEHPGQELPPPRRAGNGATVHPLTTVTDVRPRAERRVRGHGPLDQGQAVAQDGRQDLHRRPRRLLGRRARHAEPAAPARRPRAHLPRISDRLGILTRTNSEVHPRAPPPTTTPSTGRRASRSPRRSTPTSTRTSSRSATAPVRNLMSLLARPAHRRGARTSTRWRTWLGK